MSTSSVTTLGIAALLLPIGHAAGGAAAGGHGFWESFLTPPPLHPMKREVASAAAVKVTTVPAP